MIYKRTTLLARKTRSIGANGFFWPPVLFFLLFLAQSSILFSKPTILLVHFQTNYWGGIENHTLNRYKMLVNNGYNAHILVAPNSIMQSKLTQLGLPSRPFSEQNLYHDIYNACKELNIDIVMCPSAKIMHTAKRVAQQIPLKIICVRHMPIRGIQASSWKNLDGVIGVSPEIASFFYDINKKNNLGIKHIAYIPPFFDEDRFHDFSRALRREDKQETRKEYFLRVYNLNLNLDLDIKNIPVACMIGNMYHELSHKNHPLLFEALKILVFEKNKPIHVMLAGSGDQQTYLEKLAHAMGIADYVHFLGFVANIPELLFYSDFHVLTSSNEAFGQVHIEAGLMKKASIGATGTGATAIIIPEKTGLLFKNSDKNDLVTQLEKLIDNSKLSEQLGEQAYNHVCLNFSNTIQLHALECLFEKIMQGQRD